MSHIRISSDPIDSAAETAALARGRTDIGAVVTFIGVCRDDEAGEKIAALSLEHYPGMAEAEIESHVREAETRWPLLGVRVVHRTGRIEPGETIVLVAVASTHRQGALPPAGFPFGYLHNHTPLFIKIH